MSEEHPVVGNGDPLIGTVLADRYRIERRLGEGGMGAVYLARHVILEKIVALKILHAEYARRRELVERFLHEAKAASRIRHEHVIDITDFGETGDKNVFFAMEYLEGFDLATVLNREGALSWRRVKSIVLQLCAALQAAHEAGVIHRDLKPENIYLIERLGNPDFVKVLDFGVAKLTELEESGRERRLTRTGMVFGTPEYMSPEQARGEKPDPRVDIYATGCILFEMATGDVPFRGDNFMGVLSKHLFDPAPTLADRTHRTDLPEGLQEVISQAMAKDKHGRFGSMNELAVALDTLGGASGSSHPVPGSAAAARARRAASQPRAGSQPEPRAGSQPQPRAASQPRLAAPEALDSTIDEDDVETTLRRPRRVVREAVTSPHQVEPKPRRTRRGFVVGGTAAVVLGLAALALVQFAGDQPGPLMGPTPGRAAAASMAAPDAAAPPAPIVTVPPTGELLPPRDAAPAGHEPTATTHEPTATTDEPTEVIVTEEPEPQPQVRRPPPRRRDRERWRPAPVAEPVAAPPVAAPLVPAAPPPEPVTIPKTDLKDPFKRR
jgi:tRNA A-37 threonylcarbamoyl transferase component Bud32